MGVVYTAQDPRLKRQVAIKLLTADLTRDETAKQHFLQAAQAASALDHPNICTIHEINETDDGQLYLVMAYYEGETLKERIERGPLALDEAVDIATQVGRGLAEAHGAGIVHRDIKPANLLIAKGGVVKILDFGLAKLAGTEGVTQTARPLAQSPTCRLNRRAVRRSITAPTSGRWGWCCSRCSLGSSRSRARTCWRSQVQSRLQTSGSRRSRRSALTDPPRAPTSLSSRDRRPTFFLLSRFVVSGIVTRTARNRSAACRCPTDVPTRSPGQRGRAR